MAYLETKHRDPYHTVGIPVLVYKLISTISYSSFNDDLLGGLAINGNYHDTFRCRHHEVI